MKTANMSAEVPPFPVNVLLLDRYIIKCSKILGQGANGVVYLAYDNVDKCFVAVKIIHEVNRKTATEIENECEMMRKLQHPGIIKLLKHCCGEFWGETLHFIVMEFEPVELFEIVKNSNGLGEPRTLEIFAQMLCAVEYTHGQEKCHLDLKLENTLATGADSNKVKICDFGHACTQRPNQTLSGYRGSKAYVAPEIQKGGHDKTKDYDGFSADVWSLGVVFFAILMGFFPFDCAAATGPNTDWRFQRLKKAEVDGLKISPTHLIFSYYNRACLLSDEVIVLLDRMLKIDPNSRITIAEIKASSAIKGVTLSAAEKATQLAAPTVEQKDFLKQHFPMTKPT